MATALALEAEEEEGFGLQSKTRNEYESVKKRLTRRSLAVGAWCSVGAWLVGAFMMFGLEKDWSFLIALYWSAETLGTVGYGGVAPTRAVSRVLFVVWVALSLLALAYFVSTLVRAYALRAKQSHNAAKHSRREGELLDWEGRPIAPVQGRDLRSRFRNLLRLHPLVTPFLCFVLLFCVCTIGYLISEKENFLDALYFSACTISTIGYGDKEVDRNHAGGLVFVIIVVFAQLACKVYTLCRVGWAAQLAKKDAFHHIRSSERKHLPMWGLKDTRDDVNKLVWIAVGTAVSYLLLGAVFASIEHWSYGEGLYFMSVSLTTIGLGDVVTKSAFGKFLIVVISMCALFFKFYVLLLINRRSARLRWRRKVGQRQSLLVGNDEDRVTRETADSAMDTRDDDDARHDDVRSLMRGTYRWAARCCPCLSDNARFVLSMGLGVAGLLLGAVILMAVDRQSFADALYTTVNLCTTIGYGDLVPMRSSRALIVVYAFVGLAAFSALILYMERRAATSARNEFRRMKHELVPLTSAPIGTAGSGSGYGAGLSTESYSNA